jgi:hypothetical protein
MRLWAACIQGYPTSNISTEATVERRNIFKSIQDLFDGADNIKPWCSEFLVYLETRPNQINGQKIMEQYIEQYHNFTTLQNRAEYVTERANIPSETKDLMDDLAEALQSARNAADGIESGDVRFTL